MIDIPRFWKHVFLLDDAKGTCWVWTGACKDDGTGRFKQDGKELRAHWVAWEIRTGKPVPPRYMLKQTCHHPNCVRHWELAGLHRKLDPEQIRRIATSRLGLTALSRLFGVGRATILHHRRRVLVDRAKIEARGIVHG